MCFCLWLVRFVLSAALCDSNFVFDILPGEVPPIVASLARGHSVHTCVPPPLRVSQANGGALGLGTDAHPLAIGGAFPCLWPCDGDDKCCWHDTHRALDPWFAHAVFMTPKEFEWRPYKSS
jgi:hypothetical protein